MYVESYWVSKQWECFIHKLIFMVVSISPQYVDSSMDMTNPQEIIQINQHTTPFETMFVAYPAIRHIYKKNRENSRIHKLNHTITKVTEIFILQ
jgi:hypothetical protein